MSEKNTMHAIMIAASKAGSRLFRNTVGMAFQGKSERFATPTKVTIYPGDVLIRRARTVMVGLPKGSSDLLGWTTREIDEYDLGRKLAIFTACEVKGEDTPIQPEQMQFIEVVNDSGGIAIIAKSVDEALMGIRRGGGK